MKLLKKRIFFWSRYDINTTSAIQVHIMSKNLWDFIRCHSCPIACYKSPIQTVYLPPARWPPPYRDEISRAISQQTRFCETPWLTIEIGLWFATAISEKSPADKTWILIENADQSDSLPPPSRPPPPITPTPHSFATGQCNIWSRYMGFICINRIFKTHSAYILYTHAIF